jgi:hypothetical protein
MPGRQCYHCESWKRARRYALLLVLVGLTSTGAGLGAHGVGASYAQISLAPGRVEVAFLVSVEEIARHFPAGREAGREDVERSAASVRAAADFLSKHVRVSLDGGAIALAPLRADPQANAAYVRFTSSAAIESPQPAIAVGADGVFFERLGPQHVMVVTLAVEGRRQEAAVTIGHPLASLPTGYRSVLAGTAEFLGLGARHIFEGYDHVLFLVAVVLVGGSLRRLVGIVTAFTAAHTVTLGLAAFQVLTLPPRVVEGGIALSIAYVAFDNLFEAGSRHRWVLTFVFGLIHGFGFAAVLAQMNLPRSTLVPTVLAFNLGVEMGQIALVAALFPVVIWLSRQPFRRPVVVSASTAIFVVGVGWFVQRAFPSAASLW